MGTAAQETPVRPRVLVVDDDPGIRMAIRSILEGEYTITEAESVKESLAIFDRQAQDLVTLDIQMPEVTGMQGLCEFRHRSGKLPIILISGYRTFELAREALRLGANDYLTKPFSVQELRTTVKSALTKVYPDGDFGADATKSVSDFTVHLPLQDLKDSWFLSPQHRSYFLAFAQNALSDKKRTFETISVSELIKAITIQFHALGLASGKDYKISQLTHKARVECDMYLLGGALANLAVTCMLETRGNKAQLELVFDESEKTLRIFIQKPEAQLSEKTLSTFEEWHKEPTTSLDPNAAILVLTEKAAELHHGTFAVGSTLLAGRLAAISLPERQS